MFIIIFFFKDTATTEIYTLSLHDALPIFELDQPRLGPGGQADQLLPGPLGLALVRVPAQGRVGVRRSEEHTSELQSRQYLVCRLLLEKKNQTLYLLNTVDTITTIRYTTRP